MTPTAIITGAARGIGAETARALARNGTNLALAVRDPDATAELASQLRQYGVAVLVLACDVSSYPDVRGMVEAAADKLGRIDILVNNAGTMEPIGLLEDTDPAAWLQCLAVNLAGAYYTIREVLPHFHQAGSGAIVNLSSGAAFMPLRGWGAYCSAKAGLAMLTRTVAEEVSGTDIRVYGFQPGMVNTRMTREGLKKPVNVVSEMDIGDFLHPAEPAGAIAALCRRRPQAFQGTEVRYGEPDFMRWLDDDSVVK